VRARRANTRYTMNDDMRPAPPAPADLPLPSRSSAALAGLVAAGVALATGEIAAGLVRGIPSPSGAVATAVIDLAPPGSKELVVGLFGTNDKAALLVLVTVVVLGAGAGIGILARRRLLLAGLAVVALVAVGALASLRDPIAQFTPVTLAAALQVGAGLQVLFMLIAAAGPGSAVRGSTAVAAAASTGRRGFLLQAGGLGALALVGGGVGRMLLAGRADATAGRNAGPGALPIPQAISPAVTPPPDASIDLPGITPVVMPNDRFYRIDTALFTPSVDVSTWDLRVFGMVDREVRLTFAELVQLPLIERYVTISCVSNEVGGDLVGNAKWTGVRLLDVLAMAGVQAGATQVVPRSVDGWTAGFPTAWLHDPAHPRDALIAVKMNDAPLPTEHGYPARLVVPGLYGYVSATKWLKELELTTLGAFDAYWVPRGWAKEAPILTQSRIDVPRDGASVKAGSVAVGGVAWAPDRGIAKVELSVDGGPWQAATLATELSPATWVLWQWTWQATAGQHVLEVRATDGTGAVQTADVTPPDPDGARGHHRIAVSVA
jgi:DMSO/TMAO reductase YedYZ molybdopterin-dependent catalytic subunit